MKRLARASLALRTAIVPVLAATALAACSGTPAAKGTIPPGTPPPEYEPARAYTPEAPAAAPVTPDEPAPAPAPPPPAAAPAPGPAPQG